MARRPKTEVRGSVVSEPARARTMSGKDVGSGWVDVRDSRVCVSTIRVEAVVRSGRRSCSQGVERSVTGEIAVQECNAQFSYSSAQELASRNGNDRFSGVC